MTSNFSEFKHQSSQESDVRPYLWLSHPIQHSTLVATYKAVLGLKDVDKIPELPKSLHILALDPTATEADFKAIAIPLMANGANEAIGVEVYQLPRPVLDYKVDSLGSLPSVLMTETANYSDWDARLQIRSLSKDEATVIAKLMLTHYPDDSDRLLKLQALGERAGVNSYDWNQVVKKLEKQFAQQSKQSKLEEAHNKVEAALGERLTFNKMKRQVELDGHPLDMETIRLQLALLLHTDIKAEDAKSIMVSLAQRQSYSPVANYLNKVAREYGNDTAILNNFASRYFGNDSQLANTYLVRTLIAAVARAVSPGCKVDTMLILQGEQGVRKSSFVRVLAGAWFDDSFDLTGDKDEKLKMLECWLMEISEVDKLRKREASALKSFLSSSTDKLREPYGRAVRDFPRSSIFIGTTNERELLTDPTGNRRSWIIEVRKKIDTNLLQRERDQIWAAAYALYQRGEQWYLTEAEEEQTRIANKEFEIDDSWTEAVLSYCADRGSVTIAEVLCQAVGLEIGKHGRSEQMRTADILKRNGWKLKRSKRERRWYAQ